MFLVVVFVSQVHFILSELCMGGMVLETNMSEILTRIEEQNKIEKQEVKNCCTNLIEYFYFKNLEAKLTQAVAMTMKTKQVSGISG